MKPALTSVASYAIRSGSRGTLEEDRGDEEMTWPLAAALNARAEEPRKASLMLLSYLDTVD